ncbi:hypothetical protein KDX14_12900 [Burkholderia cenocepacia]|uniref:hypothetical protein n=1 Tax=Burkholderia cenocepacia TaxID=95486 RepID=UPI001B91051F|nr:hypothetical protein [Burkholderia cenocepacia]MBR8070405.1 hypothetical protein [Burkholderia cenocepacia]
MPQELVVFATLAFVQPPAGSVFAPLQSGFATTVARAIETAPKRRAAAEKFTIVVEHSIEHPVEVIVCNFAHDQSFL